MLIAFLFPSAHPHRLVHPIKFNRLNPTQSIQIEGLLDICLIFYNLGYHQTYHS